MSLTVDESLRFADQQYTKQSFAGVLTAEVRRLSAENERLRAELAQERKRLDWALERFAGFEDGQLSFSCGDKYEIVADVVDTTNPRSTIDELIAGEKK